MLKPTRGNLIVKPDPKADRTAGGIFIPATSDEGRKPAVTGVVIAVGPPLIAEKTGKELPRRCNVGDRVFYGQYAPHLDIEPHLVDGEKDCILISDEREIYAVVTPDAEVDESHFPRHYTETKTAHLGPPQ